MLYPEFEPSDDYAGNMSFLEFLVRVLIQLLTDVDGSNVTKLIRRTGEYRDCG